MAIFDESDIEAAHRALAHSERLELGTLTQIADLLHKSIRHVDFPRTDPTKHRQFLAASILGYRLRNNIGAATRLLDCGYFVQAASLGRDIAEIGMLFLYFHAYPEKFDRWIDAGERRYREFGRPKIKNDTTQYKELNKYFDLFSEFGTHPSSITIFAHHDGVNFQIGPHFNPQHHSIILYDLTRVCWLAAIEAAAFYTVMFQLDIESLFPTELAALNETIFELASREQPTIPKEP